MTKNRDFPFFILVSINFSWDLKLKFKLHSYLHLGASSHVLKVIHLFSYNAFVLFQNINPTRKIIPYNKKRLSPFFYIENNIRGMNAVLKYKNKILDFLWQEILKKNSLEAPKNLWKINKENENWLITKQWHATGISRAI